MNLKQIKAIEQRNKHKWISKFGEIPDCSGVYILSREENGFKYAYIGQAKHILTRLAQHLNGYQYIDFSLKKHGLWDFDNITGWFLTYAKCEEGNLDATEQYWIKYYADNGYQLRNKTAGGQGKGKFEIAETKPKKNYHDGLEQGYKNAIKEVRNYFDKYLDFVIKGKTNKIKERKFEEFKRWVYEETSKGDC